MTGLEIETIDALKGKLRERAEEIERLNEALARACDCIRKLEETFKAERERTAQVEAALETSKDSYAVLERHYARVVHEKKMLLERIERLEVRPQ